MMSQLAAFMARSRSGIAATIAQFADEKITIGEFETARDEIVLRLRAHIARIVWDQAEEARIRAEGDPQLQRALELFDEAAALKHQAELIDASGPNEDLRAGPVNPPL